MDGGGGQGLRTVHSCGSAGWSGNTHVGMGELSWGRESEKSRCGVVLGGYGYVRWPCNDSDPLLSGGRIILPGCFPSSGGGTVSYIAWDFGGNPNGGGLVEGCRADVLVLGAVLHTVVVLDVARILVRIQLGATPGNIVYTRGLLADDSTGSKSRKGNKFENHGEIWNDCQI